jgi:serine/threonine protein kinase
MELTAGAMVTDSVRLVEPLGEGSMGVVWVADHLRLKTRVAVKFLSERLFNHDPTALARFEQEACAAAQVKSPHVVQTFDQGVAEGGLPFIVMELLEGENVVDRLTRSGALSLDEVAQIVSQVAGALSSAHELGIVHRDVKPGNIFLVKQKSGFFCKLLDFGVAKQTRVATIAGLTESGTLLGTPEYMSPEQLMKSDDVDESVDLWALAASAYSMLTDELPFDGRTLGALCVQILNAQFQPPSEHRPDLPPALDRWFTRAFHIKPAARFQTAEDLATSFRAACEGKDFEEAEAEVDETPVESDELRAAALDIAHKADAATFSGSSTDARKLVPAKRSFRWLGAVAGLAIGVGLVVAVQSRSGGHASDPKPASSTEAQAVPTPEAIVAPTPSGSVIVAPSAANPPAASDTPQPEQSVERSQPPARQLPPPYRPRTRTKRKGAAPNKPGF